MSLSDRVRAGSEAAPWVVGEIVKLEGECARLRARVERLERVGREFYAATGEVDFRTGKGIGRWNEAACDLRAALADADRVAAVIGGGK